MFPPKMRSNRLFALGVTCTFSLVSIAMMLIVITSAQGDAPRAGQRFEFETDRTAQQDAIVRVEPTVAVVENGETFRIYIMIEDAVNLGGFQFVIDYNPAIVEVPNQSTPVALGPFLGSTGRTPTELQNAVDPTTGIITYVVFTIGSAPGPDGDGVLAFVDMRARALGTTVLDLQDVEVTDTGGTSQGVSVGDGLVVVSAPPSPAQISIQKSADAPTVVPQGLLTYTLQRSFTLAGQHSYNEIVFDPIPNGTTYLLGSAAWNGLPSPQLYSTTLDAIYFQNNGVFTDTDQWALTFQVQVESASSGTLIVNTVTQTTSFDGTAYSGPYTSSATVCTVPAAPNLATPASGSSTCDTTPYFDWSSVSGATSYRIQVDDNSSFSSPEIDTTISNSSYTPASPLSVDTYYWRVQASNSCGTGPRSVMQEFTVESCIYSPIVLKDY